MTQELEACWFGMMEEKVRRLMEVEAANMLRIPRMSVSELNRKGLGARYWLGSTVPWEVKEERKN